ncbi:MAG: hypothetical protein H0W76_26400 [Pyrinomonadaceae bacterium]|nr:hypothetical protein [Pyrinomonadaceae bacterium]
MAENENALAPASEADDASQQQATIAAPEQETTPPAPTSTEEITYHAVEKDGQVTALWEMQGPKHLRTIDPRSRQGQEILRLYTAEHPEEHATAQP